MKQLALFAPPPAVEVRADPEAQSLGSRLPPGIRLGTSSWTFPGWPIWAHPYSIETLAQHGLAAYAQYPLFRTVGLDRTWYRPMPASELRALRDAVPADFRFLVKAHEDVTNARFPVHARYGNQKGKHNPRFLDLGYAMDAVVAPFVEALGGGVLLFAFAPQALPDAFPDQLYTFLSALPKGPWHYAVEIRTPAALTAAYADALESADVLPALVGWAGMPGIRTQALRTRALSRKVRVVRWMLAPGTDYESAKARFAPFTGIHAADDEARGAIVESLEHAEEGWVVINNKAEGCGPVSVRLLAEALAHVPSRTP